VSRRQTLSLALLAAGLIIAGCGGDESGEATVPSISIPSVTAPSVSTPAPTTHPDTTPDTVTTPGKTANPSEPDSATNDLPPAPGSPEEAFEKQCQENPAACG
jgi:ABC-type glycerol-3-phosphate transport system substrate-binding protein